ncbi:MAG: gamma-glutamyltransferase [Runella slithyformis]|nr:MAG: gamma-glutamyltransferase [Runella slithyformis]TAF01208.1 MAG: gamma-glutamyltransferase [Runella slithyformis]TAF25137.1 MAG: gamma-glutamyltransferase [Runella slithyformis]TAF49842.1 MAG: gamma-glutamyltransferase [Runella slithyformis]TAF81357.1 MAG: gamma-glutamyltransferase [Runella slithyformis]
MQKILLTFSILHFAFYISTATAQQVNETKGFYQFLTDDPNQKPFFSDKKGVFASNGMVASAHPEASRVGVEILKAGGNATDATVAVQFALAVVHPSAGNIGGGGFFVYRTAQGQNYTLDFREKAPLKGNKDMYLDAQGNVVAGLSMTGHLASGVPGSVDGMAEAHKKFGKLPWETLLQPAVDLAEKGHILTEKEARGLNMVKPTVQKVNPNTPYFAKPDGQDWKAGDVFVQTDLANILRLIQKKGRKGFYKGQTAKLLVAEMKRGKGLISKKDLRQYHSTWREPLVGTYKDFKIITMPPVSSGGVALLQLMKLVEPYPLKRWGWNTDSTVQVMIEAERRVYADRAKFLGDPDFVKVPVQELTDPNYLKERWRSFDFAKATDSKTLQGGTIAGYESTETTHFSIVDKEGNASSVTTTLNGGYGSKVVVAGAGFLMNNEMDDFSIKPGVPNMFGLIGNKANAIAPGKRMLSSMTPTIIEQNGKLHSVVGTPGGSTIITSVFQTVLNVLEHGMSMQQAVNALKFHHQWLPDKTVFETNGFTENTIKKLQSRGYILEVQKNTIGRMDCILVQPDGTLEGGSDPRGDDTSVGH